VDQDANIIVGATFDEGLDGIIRVSVVATGIDHAVSAQAAPVEARIADLTQRVRADTQRMAERIERSDHAAMRPHPQQPMDLDHVAKAAVAAAVLPSSPMEDVTIRPIPQKPSLFLDPAQGEVPIHEQPPKAFIPPAAERIPGNRAPRMPRIDELPIPAQNEIRAKRGDLPEDEHPEKRRMTLLQRLASVGLGRKDEDPEPVRPVRPVARPAPQSIERPRPPLPPRQAEARPQDPVSEYARRPAPQGLDPHGRQTPVHNSYDDDQLDIPAFLRRQAN
jgi:cell division protein FtsZ